MSASIAARWQRELRTNKILELITAAADSDAPCPTNRVLCRAIGVSSSATVSTMIETLENRGAIRVERMNDARVVEIVATGRKTAVPQKWAAFEGPATPAQRGPRNKVMSDMFDDALAETGNVEAAGAAVGISAAAAYQRFSRIRRELGPQAN